MKQDCDHEFEMSIQFEIYEFIRFFKLEIYEFIRIKKIRLGLNLIIRNQNRPIIEAITIRVE